MPNKHGDFIWYELMTDDLDAAQKFYRALLGWTFQDGGQEGMDYRIFSAKGEGVGGFMALTDEMTADGARHCWLGYINGDAVDAAAKSLKERGWQHPSGTGGYSGRRSHCVCHRSAGRHVLHHEVHAPGGQSRRNQHRLRL